MKIRFAILGLSLMLLTGCASGETTEARPSYTSSPVQIKNYAINYIQSTYQKMSINRNGNCSGIFDSLLVTYKLYNKTTEKISAISGRIVILNAFNDELKSVSFTTSKPLFGHTSMTVGTTGSKCYKLNSYTPGDSEILNMSSGDTLKVGLFVHRIKFANGEDKFFDSSEIYNVSDFKELVFN